MNRRLPVTLVGGFLGAGKTSLLHHFVSEHPGGHLALLVENPGTLNLDAKALAGLCGAMRRQYDIVLEIPSTDDVTQIEWMADRLRELSAAGRYEQVVIEVSGLANATVLAHHFGAQVNQPKTFTPWAELRQIVCVIDALDFHRTFVAPPPQAPETDLLDFQREQIQGASLMVLNKCDLVSDAEREACLRLLLSLNAYAKIIETAYGEVPPEILSHPATPEELGGTLEVPAASDPTPPDLASALYRAYRPFHPERFWNWYNAEHPGLLRIKGLIWLASRTLLVGGVSRTRWQNSCGAAGIWWAALPREEWPEDPEVLMRMQETWREPYGDRRQELVLIGDTGLLAHLNQQLDACFLTEEEYSRPTKDWSTLTDPFPVWDVEGG